MKTLVIDGFRDEANNFVQKPVIRESISGYRYIMVVQLGHIDEVAKVAYTDIVAPISFDNDSDMLKLAKGWQVDVRDSLLSRKTLEVDSFRDALNQKSEKPIIRESASGFRYIMCATKPFLDEKSKKAVPSTVVPVNFSNMELAEKLAPGWKVEVRENLLS